MIRILPAFASLLLVAGFAHAQSSNGQLNLKLPNDMPPAITPATSSTAAKPATPVDTKADGKNAPGIYYGDTSGRPYHDGYAARPDACDDATYNNTQVHGSVGMGVVGGNHVSGNYQTGDINFTKRTGSCDHPTGGVSVSIGVGQGQFHGR